MRRCSSFLLLTGLLATSSGLALALHEGLEGAHHDEQQCPVCHHLTTGAKAVVIDSYIAIASYEPACDELGVSAQQIHIICILPAISQRGPPLA